MKYLLMTALGLLAASSMSLAAGDYTVNGRIEGYSGRILLLRPVSLEKSDTLASVLTSDGSFSISGTVDAPAEASLEAPGAKLSVPLFLEDGAGITVDGVSGRRLATVTGGGELQQCRNRYGDIERESERRCDSIKADFKANYNMNDPIWRTQLRCALRAEADRLDAAEDEFIAQNDNMVSVSLIASRCRGFRCSVPLLKRLPRSL